MSMGGEKNLKKLIEKMEPELNAGEYIFSTLKSANHINREYILGEFKGKEGVTLILERSKADELGLSYDFIASWITLSVHSDLNAVGLTAAFSKCLTKHEISCNIVSGYFHDHIFVSKTDEAKALTALRNLSKEFEDK